MPSIIDYEITTVARVKDRLALSQTDVTRDLVLKRLMYSVTQFIERACGGRRFKRQTIVQEVYDGSESEVSFDRIILKNAPVIAGQTVTVEYNNGTYDSASWVAMPTGSIQSIDLEAGIIYFNGAIPKGKQNIRISYTAGYLIDYANEFDGALHTLPFDIGDLADRLITRLFKKRESEGKSIEGFQTSQITWGSFVEAHDREIIANYSRSNFV